MCITLNFLAACGRFLFACGKFNWRQSLHEVEVDGFEAGVIYDVKLLSKDRSGNVATEDINLFSTSNEDVPPVISQIQTDSAISPGNVEKVQTVISWITNEPSTTKIYYQKGFGSDDKFSNETKIDSTYSKKHIVVITKFDAGSVYRFKTESIDSKSNIGISKIYTILTPRQKETVFQVIMKNVEDLFGWVGKLNR